MPIDTLHPAVARQLAKWERTRDVLSGPDALKDMGQAYGAAGVILGSLRKAYRYLPRLPGQSIVTVPGYGMVDEYLLYLDRAVPLCGYAQRVHRGLAGMVARKPSQFVVPDSLTEQLQDVTLDGRSADALAHELVSEDLQTAWGAVLTDWSAREGRPYLRAYCAEAVTNFRVEVLSGQPIVTGVVLSECARESDPGDPWAQMGVEQRRELFLAPHPAAAAQPALYPLGAYTQQLWRENPAAQTDGVKWLRYGPPIVPTRLDRPLPFLPIAPFTDRSSVWMPGDRAPLLALVDLILAHYKNSADYEHAIHCAGVPTLQVWGLPRYEIGADGQQVQVQIGPGRVICGENPAGHASYVMTEGLGAKEIKDAMDTKEAQMAVMSSRMMLARERRVAETAEAQRVSFAADDADLTEVVTGVEQALQFALTWYVWWAGSYVTVEEASRDVTVRLNRDFIEGTLPTDDMTRMGLEVDAGRFALEDYYEQLRRGERTMATSFAQWLDMLRADVVLRRELSLDGDGAVASIDAAIADAQAA